MSDFCKNEKCPPSEVLLAFQSGDLAVGDSGDIRRHLLDCEFCSAEAAFYERYPQTDDAAEPIEATDIPQPLYDLAEALLSKRRDQDLWRRLMSDNN